MRKIVSLFCIGLWMVTAVFPLAAGQTNHCEAGPVGFVPLTDLGRNFYQGYEGGLYGAGSNSRPYLHEAAGLALANHIEPLSPTGIPSTSGKIGFLGVGMSNAEAEFEQLMAFARRDTAVNPAVVMVNGAQHGKAAQMMANSADNFWPVLLERVQESGLTPLQVQVAWLKEAHAEVNLSFPQDALLLQQELIQIVQLLYQQFPNLKIIYLSSRSYGGYAELPLSPEPFAYQSGFAVKWLIQAQIAGDPQLNYAADRGPIKAPWLAWGPYLWADGTTPRQDGMTWSCHDFQADGTHPAVTGRIKVARLLGDFLRQDTTAVPWFLRASAQTIAD